MKTIIAASKNANKIREMDAITRKLGMRIISRDEAGVPDVEIVEDGMTFEENSFKKADVIMRMTGKMAIADDSGLEVEWLRGAPGVYSARFAGEECSDEKNNEKLLTLMEGVPYRNRGARFVSVITLVYPDGTSIAARGECYGHLLTSPEGSNGFGYDPLFVPSGYQRTFAQLAPEEKNKISHRARALDRLAELLREREQ